MKESKSIFDILDEWKDIREQLEESEGELTPELEEALAINRNDIHDKVESIFYVIDKYKSEEAFIKGQEDRLAAKKKVYVNIQNRLKNLVDIAVANYGEENIKSKAKGWKSRFIETPTVKATAISYPVLDQETFSLISDPITQLPSEYVKHKIVSSEVTVEQKDKLTELARQVGIQIQFSVDINVSLIKEDLMSGVVIPIKDPNILDLPKEAITEEIIGELKLSPNFKVKFS